MNITELKLLLTKLEWNNSPIDVLLLCETFLNKKTERLVHIPHYKLHSNSRTNHKGGGTSIMIRDGIIHKRRKDLEMMLEKEAESTCVEMTAKCGKKIILGSVYKSPNTKEDKLKAHLTELCIKSKHEKKEIVIGMDHHMDLLKSHEY